MALTSRQTLFLAAAVLALAGAAVGLAPHAVASSGSGEDGTVDDQIDDQIDDQVEDAVEDQVEDNVEDAVEDTVEDSVEDAVEETVEASVEDTVEDDVEDTVEDGVEGDVENGVEDRIDDRIEDRIDDKSGSGSSGSDDRRGERKIEDRIEPVVVGASISDEDDFDRAEELAKADYEAAIAAADAERDAARHAARLARDEALAQPGADEDAIKAKYELAIAAIDETREASREAAKASYSSALLVIGAAEDAAKESSSGGGDKSDDESGKGSSRSGSGDGDGQSSSPQGRELFEVGLDEEGNEIGRGEWLILAPPDAIGALTDRGYVAKQVQSLDGLGLALIRLEAPESFSIAQAEAAIRAAAPDAEVDYNHLYHPNGSGARKPRGARPGALLEMPRGEDGRGHAIGVIDTNVDLAHPALQNAHVRLESFVTYANPEPTAHGTSVVSILAGAAPDYHGLVPQAEIFAASVFFTAPEGGDTATTVSLVRALDWMAANRVPVVNMSLAGPDNAILHGAIDRAYAKGMIVVAAVGNEGPAARPLYPAGYDHVVAVTAVSRSKKVYRLANRGDYVDFAAPGVDVLHAAGSGGFAASSGTSMASPFVAAALAVAVENGGRLNEDALRQFVENAEDLGAKGFDPIYGNGLIRPLQKLGSSGAR